MAGSKRSQNSKKSATAALPKKQAAQQQQLSTKAIRELHDGNIHIFFKDFKAAAAIRDIPRIAEAKRTASDLADHDRLPLQLEAIADASISSRKRVVIRGAQWNVRESRTAFLRRRLRSATAIEDTKPRDDALKAEIRKTRREASKIDQQLQDRLKGSKQQEQVAAAQHEGVKEMHSGNVHIFFKPEQQARVAAQPIPEIAPAAIQRTKADLADHDRLPLQLEQAATDRKTAPAAAAADQKQQQQVEQTTEKRPLIKKTITGDMQRAAAGQIAHQDPNQPKAYFFSPSRFANVAKPETFLAPHQHCSRTHQNLIRPVQGRSFNFGHHQRPVFQHHASHGNARQVLAGHTNAANPYFMIPH